MYCNDTHRCIDQGETLTQRVIPFPGPPPSSRHRKMRAGWGGKNHISRLNWRPNAADIFAARNIQAVDDMAGVTVGLRPLPRPIEERKHPTHSSLPPTPLSRIAQGDEVASLPECLAIHVVDGFD